MLYPASNASTFIGSIGVNTHLSWTSTPYGNLAQVESELSYLGLHNIRDNVANTTQEYNALSALAGMGVKVDMIANTDLTGFLSLAHNLDVAHPGDVIAVEGLNEVAPGSTTAAQLQQSLFNGVQADPVLAGAAIYNLSLAGPTTFGSSLSADATYANAHIYYGGGQPAYGWSPNDSTYWWSSYLSAAEANAPGRPVVVTETGATTAIGNQTSVGVDQATQAKQILNSLMDGAKSGVAMNYIYELVDSRNNGPTDSESHFGLYNWDGTAKIAASAIHDFTSILTSHGALSGTPGALDYSVSGVPQWGGQMLFEQGDGTYDVVVWAEPDIWNENTSTPITAPNTPITLTLANAANVSIYDPMVGATPVQSLGTTNQATFNITDHPYIIEVSPGASSPASSASSPASTSAATSAPANIPKDATPTLVGTAAAGSTVTLLDGTTQVGVATTDGAGHWTIASSTLADGAHTLTASVGGLAVAIDKALETGLYRSYSVTAASGSAVVAGGPEGGTDSLTDIGRIQFVDGYVATGTTDTAGEVYRLYEAALGRAPDPAGLANWTHALNSGQASLPSEAGGFVNSTEFQSRYGALDNTGFVTLLYSNVLHRAPDTAGLANWVGLLNAGHTRAEVVLGFSESQEEVTDTSGAVQHGLWVQDAAAAEVARLYDTVLGRLPDSGGEINWTQALESGGMSLLQATQGFVASAEFQSAYGALDDSHFVQLLYQNALHRAADPQGLTSWVNYLAAGHSRAEVVLGFSESPEHIADAAPHIDQGIWFA